MGIGERPVAVVGIAAHTDHDGTGLSEVFVRIAKCARLCRTYRRIVPRVEEQHDRGLSLEVRQRDLAAIVSRRGELGSTITDFDAVHLWGYPSCLFTNRIGDC